MGLRICFEQQRGKVLALRAARRGTHSAARIMSSGDSTAVPEPCLQQAETEDVSRDFRHPRRLLIEYCGTLAHALVKTSIDNSHSPQSDSWRARQDGWQRANENHSRTRFLASANRGHPPTSWSDKHVSP